MKKKLIALSTFVLAAGLLAGIVTATNTMGGLFNPAISVSNVEPLVLDKNDNSMETEDGDSLPADGSQTFDVLKFEIDQYTHINTCYASKNNNMFIRLNKTTAEQQAEHGASYFEKDEPCYGMTSITIDLNFGWVNILTGNEKGIFSNKYVVKKDSVDKDTQIQATIDVEGNYFRVENVHSDQNALVKSISITYGCEKETKINDTYQMARGSNQDSVRANPGHWFYHTNGKWAINENPTPTFSNYHFESTITKVDSNTSGVWYRYQPKAMTGLTNEYKFSYTVTLNVDGIIAERDGSNQKSVQADIPYNYVSNGFTFSDSTQPYYIKVYTTADAPAGGITVAVTNIMITRYVAYTPNNI